MREMTAMTSLLCRLCALLACLLLPLQGALAKGEPPSGPARDGFFAAAFHSEYGDTQRDALIRWEIPLSVYVRGTPTVDDMQTLQSLADDLKQSVPGLPEISFAAGEGEANVFVSFVPFERMSKYLVHYETGNWGFMNCLSSDTTIRYGLIAIAADVTEQEDRNHLIREEFVNMLGLTADIDTAPESIIYQPYTRTQSLAPVDYEMLNLLYSPYMRFGMSAAEAQAALNDAFDKNGTENAKQDCAP